MTNLKSKELLNSIWILKKIIERKISTLSQTKKHRN